MVMTLYKIYVCVLIVFAVFLSIAALMAPFAFYFLSGWHGWEGKFLTAGSVGFIAWTMADVPRAIFRELVEELKR